MHTSTNQWHPSKGKSYFHTEMFKLCSVGGYTYNMITYTGARITPRHTGRLTDSIVMDLIGWLTR